MVSDEFGHIPEYRGVTGTPWGLNGPTWALVEERGRGQEVGVPPQYQSELGRGPTPVSFFSSSPSSPLLLGLGKGGNLLLVGVGVAIRPQTVKSLCLSVIPGSVMLTHTVLEWIYKRVAITHLLHRMSQERAYYNKYGLRPSK